jgi:hypothetical protein
VHYFAVSGSLLLLAFYVHFCCFSIVFIVGILRANICYSIVSNFLSAVFVVVYVEVSAVGSIDLRAARRRLQNTSSTTASRSSLYPSVYVCNEVSRISKYFHR